MEMNEKALEEIKEKLRNGGCVELDMDSLEQATGGTRNIRTREQLLRVMNGDDVHMFLDLEKQAKDAQAALRAAPMTDSADLLAPTAAIQLQYAMTFSELLGKYNSGTVVPTPNGDIIIPD